jgi:hypothetical protein
LWRPGGAPAGPRLEPETMTLDCFISFLAGVIYWLPFAARRQRQPEEIDREVSDTWCRFVDGEITEAEAAQRDTELRLRRARPP